MTRKDYVRIAAAIKRANDGSPSAEENRGVRFTANEIADALQAENVRFDRKRFLTACGISV